MLEFNIISKMLAWSFLFNREDFEKTGLSSFVTVGVRDIQGEGFPDEFSGLADSIFLDLPQPWLAIPSAGKMLKEDGVLCSFSPCIEQVQRSSETLRSNFTGELSSGFLDLVVRFLGWETDISLFFVLSQIFNLLKIHWWILAYSRCRHKDIWSASSRIWSTRRKNGLQPGKWRRFSWSSPRKEEAALGWSKQWGWDPHIHHSHG